MPVYSRKQLRRDLGAHFTYDILSPEYIPNPSSFGVVAIAGSPIVYGGPVFASPDASGQDLFQGAWMYVEASFGAIDAGSAWYQYIVGTYNAGSGAFISNQAAADYHGSFSAFELHTKVPPKAKEFAIDDTIKRVRIRQEVAINTVDGALVYTIEGAASPNYLEHILDVHLMANPNNSLDLDLRHMQDWQVVTTATGRELRLKWGVKGSQQIIFDAILIPSLGGENATINLPDERWVLAGAAMRCYDFMIQSAPGQQVSQLMQRRAEWAAEYTRLSARFMPTYEEPIRLHDVIRGMTPRPWDSASNFW